MNTSTLLENQLLATKFYVPVAPDTIISRPRLSTLLDQSLESPLTLISAPAGFGKTTLLATWGQALPANIPRLAWLSLDEEDNDPRLFWTYVLSALNRQEPQRFTPLLTQLQSPHAPPLKYLLTMLINLLAESTDHFLLILDDYQVITEQQVHSSLSYLVEHLPSQLHIILSTRVDPPLPLPQLRARGLMLEVRTDQLRCTAEETAAFLKKLMGLQLPNETIQEVTARTEGWLVGLQLLTLSLPEQTDPLTLLQATSGDQRYILDYLTEVVLRQQPQEIQTFLLCTSILERLTAPLCDAVMEQTGSQQIFQQLERANLFVVSLDNKRQWYRYHALFAETLRHRLEQIHADLMPTLHHRASIWYAQHNQTTLAILHAFNAHQWQWAADLIERISVASLTWGASQYALIVLRDWLMQLPADIMHSRPRLCLIGAEMLWPITPQSILEVWIDTAEAMLITSLRQQPLEDASPMSLASQTKQDLENLLAEVFSFRAFMRCHEGDGPMVLALCQQALTLASAENFMAYSQVAWSRLMAYYYSVNDAVAAIENGLQTISLAQAAGQTLLAICHTGITVMHMIGTRRLHEAYRLTQQAIEQARQSNGLVLPDACWPTLLQAEILREWNELDAALALVEEAIPLCKQVTSHASFVYLLYGYAILLRILLSRGDLDAARNALQECEHIGTSINQSTYMVVGSFSIVIDQVRFWLAYGQLDDVRQLVEKLELGTTPIPFVHEREEVACARILLAKLQPAVALQRLKPVLQRATAGQRWGHVIEIRIVQALAYQILQQETQALDILSETIRLAEPEGYIRSFVDEGPPIEALLYQLRKQERKHGPTPYLDTVIAAFQQENMAHVQTGEPTKAQPLPKSLSERELEVLQLLARGASNLEIAQELVIAVDTVKRHVRQILSKLGVKDRFQAVKHARELDLLDEMQGT